MREHFQCLFKNQARLAKLNSYSTNIYLSQYILSNFCLKQECKNLKRVFEKHLLITDATPSEDKNNKVYQTWHMTVD